jgi:lycopene cyclase CruA
MFRDEMKLDELVSVMLRVAWRYPGVLRATWEKLGPGGSAGFLKNLAGWALSPTK